MEIVMIVAAVVLAVKVADLEDKSTWTWGAVALVLCGASIFVPYLPFLRVLIAAVLVFVLMVVSGLLGKA